MANHILENTNLPTSSQQELEIEYEKWKSTVVSILDNMEDGSNMLSVRQNQKRKSRDDRSRLEHLNSCLLYTSPSPRDRQKSRMPSSA